MFSNKLGQYTYEYSWEVTQYINWTNILLSWHLYWYCKCWGRHKKRKAPRWRRKKKDGNTKRKKSGTSNNTITPAHLVIPWTMYLLGCQGWYLTCCYMLSAVVSKNFRSNICKSWESQAKTLGKEVQVTCTVQRLVWGKVGKWAPLVFLGFFADFAVATQGGNIGFTSGVGSLWVTQGVCNYLLKKKVHKGLVWSGNIFKPGVGCGKDNIRAACWNVAKTGTKCQHRVIEVMKMFDLDFLVLTETGLLEQQEKNFLYDYKDKYGVVYASTTKSKSTHGGIAVIGKNKWMQFAEGCQVDQVENRFVSVFLPLTNTKNLILGGYYGHVREEGDLEAQLAAAKCVDRWVGHVNSRHIEGVEQLWMGDCNWVANSKVDKLVRRGGTLQPAKRQDYTEHMYDHFTESTGMLDSWKQKHGDLPGFTRLEWRFKSAKLAAQSRLDYIFTTPDLSEGVIAVGVAESDLGVNTDHCLVVVLSSK